MTEKIKLALLAGMLGTLLWTAAHPKPQVGKFVIKDDAMDPWACCPKED